MNGKQTKRQNMKKALLLIAAMLLLGSAGAQVNWHTIGDASKAKIGTRIYFVDFYTTWCGWCKRMDRDTFSDPTVSKILNKYYYPVKFDAEGNDKVVWNGHVYPPAAAGRHNVHTFTAATLGKQAGFPSYALFRPDGSLVQVVPGYYKPDEFVVVLWYFASGDSDKYSFEHYKGIFDKDIRPTMEKELR